VGQLLKLILISIAIAVLLTAIRRLLTGRNEQVSRNPAESAVQNMVKCEHCGTFIPESEAFFNGRQPYCSKEHHIRSQK
jgi:uncharacterized protein